MPDRAYYLTDSPKMADLRAKYQAHIAAMLKLAGYADSDARAAKVFALETEIAKAHASREDSADVLKANNPWTLKDFSAKAPGIDWPAFFKAAKLGGQDKFIVWHPSAVKGAAALVAGTDLATWKDFLAFHQVNHFAPNLSKAFADQRFAFHGKALSGTPEQSLRWKRALAATSCGAAGAGRPHVRRPLLPGREQGARAPDGDQHHRRLQQAHRQARLDGAGHPRAGPGQAQDAVRRHRLSRQVAIV